MKNLVNKTNALLKLDRRVVGVKLVHTEEDFQHYDAVTAIAPISYCVAVKSATLGHALKFTSQNSGYRGSTRALGLQAPTEEFYNGTAGCGLGLYHDKQLAAEVAEKMKICKADVYGIVVKPLEQFEGENTPDVVLIVSDTRTAMRMIQGYTYFYGMQENFCMTGNQAVCVEGTAVPLLTGKINISLFCSGTRFLAGWKDSEVVVGIPYEKFSQTVEGIRLTVNAVEMDERKREIREALKPLGYCPEEITLGNAYYIQLEEEKRKKRKEKKVNKEEKKLRNMTAAIRSVLIIGLLLLWEIAARNKWYNPFFTSYPTEILTDMLDFIKSGDLAYHTVITLREAFLGLLIGTVLGVLTGVVFGQFVTIGKIFTPILTAINGIPQLTLAPVYVLWFGLGLSSKVFLAALMVFFCVFFSTYNAIKNTEQKLVESAHILGANSLQTLWHVVLPYCMPWILSGIRSGVGACMVGAIIGEYMGASGGFGWMVTYATSYFMIRRVMSCILILLLVGMILNWILDFAERRILRWKVDTKLSLEISEE